MSAQLRPSPEEEARPNHRLPITTASSPLDLPWLQVIATFLQFDEADIVKLQAVRQQKAAAQAGLLGQAASLFLPKTRR